MVLNYIFLIYRLNQTITLLFTLKPKTNYFTWLTCERAAIMQTILSFLVCKQTAEVNFSTAGKNVG